MLFFLYFRLLDGAKRRKVAAATKKTLLLQKILHRMSNDIRHIRIEDYDYPLPDERIAKFPLSVRDSSKLLVCKDGIIGEDVFAALPRHLPEGALMVFNNTRVIQARLHFRKETGALIEVFCLEPLMPREYASMFARKHSCVWLCMVGNLKKWKHGPLTRTIDVGGQQVELSVCRLDEGNDVVRGTSYCTTSTPEFPVRFTWSSERGDISFAEVLQACGELPIPPYLNRATQESDLRTYQTVYSKIEGSVAAPTAGLHFTEQVLQALDAHGIERDEVTLHVGAGTFKPVKSEFISGHEMHAEYIVVRRATIEKLIRHGGEAIAVGTTSVRTLESLYYIGLLILRNPDIQEEELHIPQWMPYEDDCEQPATVEALQAILQWMERNGLEAFHTTTQIIIVPGYRFHIVSRMVTNFHQPKSTLLLLVSAFVGNHADGTPVWRDIYDFALTHGFRFLSYGDSSLLSRRLI